MTTPRKFPRTLTSEQYKHLTENGSPQIARLYDKPDDFGVAHLARLPRSMPGVTILYLDEIAAGVELVDDNSTPEELSAEEKRQQEMQAAYRTELARLEKVEADKRQADYDAKEAKRRADFEAQKPENLAAKSKAETDAILARITT